MKYTTTTSQNNFYHARGWIYFEKFFEPEEIQEVRNLVLPSVKSHDLFREFPLIKTALYNKITPSILDLEDKTTLRLAYDHFFNTQLLPKEYAQLFSKPELTLAEISSFQGLLSFAIIVLEDNGEESPPFKRDDTILCKKGDVIILSAKFPIDFTKLVLKQNIQFILVAFGNLDLVYSYNEKDPKKGFLKEMGYHPGDRLKGKTHPCFRKKG